VVIDKQVIFKHAGTCIITANQAGNATFKEAAPVARQLIIEKNDQTISFTPINNRNYNEFPLDMAASSTSGLEVVFSVQGHQVQVSKNTIIDALPGEITIIAMQNGNLDFLPASPVAQTLCISRPPNSSLHL